MDASGDEAATAKLLRGSVMNAGVWFDDPECAAQLPIGELRPDRFPVLAKCLAALRLQASSRIDALPDVTVVTYGPGFELEARIIDEREGPRLTWIGFAGRRNEADNAPTISATALERLRTSGDARGPLEANVARELEGELGGEQKAAYAWLKVCLDDQGGVAAVHPFEATSIKAWNAFTSVARTWTFKPFTRLGRPLPICAMVRLAHPATAVAPTERLPMAPPDPPANGQRLIVAPTMLEGRRVAGSKFVIPDDDTKLEIMKAGVTRIAGVFRICLDPTGNVSATMMQGTGFAAYDRKILTELQRWRYSPYIVDGKAIEVCTAVTFIYSQR